MTRQFVFVLSVAVLVTGCDDELQPEGILARNDKCKEQWGGCEPLPPPPVLEPSLPEPGVALKKPMRMAVTATGWLLVTDTQQRKVLRVSPATLESDQALSVEGQPVGIAMAGDRIFVGNVVTHSVEIHAADGSPAGTLGPPGSMGAPVDIAVDTLVGRIFVLDAKAREVRVFDMEGAELPSVGRGSLGGPSGLAINEASQEVYVADYNAEVRYSAKVLVFDYDGPLVASFSGPFSRPAGLAVDGRSGRIFVTDIVAGEVTVFDRATRVPVDTLGGEAGPPELVQPFDVGIAGTSVLVLSKGAGRIEVFPGVVP